MFKHEEYYAVYRRRNNVNVYKYFLSPKIPIDLGTLNKTLFYVSNALTNGFYFLFS